MVHKGEHQLSIIGGGVLVREKDIHQHTLRSSLLLGRSSAKLKGGAMVFGSIFGLATSSPPEGGGEAGASPPPSGGEDNFGEGPPSGGQPPSSFREGALSPQERGSGDSGSTPRSTAAVSPRAASSQQLPPAATASPEDALTADVVAEALSLTFPQLAKTNSAAALVASSSTRRASISVHRPSSITGSITADDSSIIGGAMIFGEGNPPPSGGKGSSRAAQDAITRQDPSPPAQTAGTAGSAQDRQVCSTDSMPGASSCSSQLTEEGDNSLPLSSSVAPRPATLTNLNPN